MGRALDRVDWAARVGPYRGLGFKVAIRVTDLVLGDYLDRILASLSADGLEAAHVYSVVGREPPGGARRSRLYLDDRRLVTTPSPAEALATLLWHLNRSAVGSAPGHLIVHAAALEHGGGAILLPAASGSGKTTLAAGLVKAGMGYLSDEVAAIHPTTLAVTPYPKPLTVKVGSWDVLAGLAPLAADVPGPYREQQWHVDPRAIRPGSIAAPCRPRLLVFPCYRPGAATRLVPLGRAEAVVRLATHTFSRPEPAQRGLDVLAEVVRACDAFTLVVGDLDEACAAVRSL